MPEALWPGPFGQEAARAFHRATASGMNTLRSLVVGSVASFRDCWMFQREMARRLGCSVRTVQRGLRQARDLGLIECHRAKPNEKAPGLGRVVECGWSHRWAIGWGKATELAKVAVNVARIAKTIPRALRRTKTKPVEVPRRWTPEQIEAELARRLAMRPPD
jgi:DNA-binding Lrp family transcriptional regulator